MDETKGSEGAFQARSLDGLRRIRYLSGHYTTVQSSTMSEIYLHATRAIPEGEPIFYPPEIQPLAREHPTVLALASGTATPQAAHPQRTGGGERDVLWREAVRSMQRGYQDIRIDCNFPLNGDARPTGGVYPDCQCSACAPLRALLAGTTPPTAEPKEASPAQPAREGERGKS